MSVAVYQAARVGGILPNYTRQWLFAKLHTSVAANQTTHVSSYQPNYTRH
jgi:hypothetical protein